MSGLLSCAGVESQAQWMRGLVSAMCSLFGAMSMLGDGVLCRLASAMSGLASAMSGLASAVSCAQLSCVGVESQAQWDATFLVPSAVAAVLEDDEKHLSKP
jgi:hypothetical protein